MEATSPDGTARSLDERTRRRLLARAAHRIQRLDLRDTWQVAAGAFIAVLGIVIILFSWYGAAHTAYVQQQIPYLVSGSFIGLGLMVLGGLLYWAHWLYRVYDQADLHNEAAMARQEDLINRLIDAVERLDASERVDAGPPPTRRRATSVARVSSGHVAAAEVVEPLVVTAAGTSVHRPDCAIVARHPNGARRVSPAESASLTRCRICRPALD